MDIENSQVRELLAKLRGEASPDVHYVFDQMAEFYEKRLWYQLTKSCEGLFSTNGVPKTVLIALFNQFIRLWSKSMNQLAYTKMAVKTAELMDSKEALQLMEELAQKIKKENLTETLPVSYILAHVEAAHYYLKCCSGTNEVEMNRARDYIDECIELVESSPANPPTEIQASVYRISALYDKATFNYTAFYRHAILYLSCLSGESHKKADRAASLFLALPELQRLEMAHDLSIAALLSDDLYNFGELIEHSILEALRGSSYEFLLHLITAFNSGRLDVFVSEAAPLYQAAKAHPALSAHLEFLQEKLCLMTLAQVLFVQLKTSRRCSFGVISGATNVPLDQVEFLLIRAMSCHIIRGQIDQVAGEVTITWIQPRVLNDSQLGELLSALRVWRDRATATIEVVQSMKPAILASTTYEAI